MVFTSPSFLFFFLPIFFGIYYLLPDKARNFFILLAPVPIDPLNLLVRDPITGALQHAKKKDEIAEFAAPFGMMFLLMMIVMVGTAPMLSGVTEDKNQRIFE